MWLTALICVSWVDSVCCDLTGSTERVEIVVSLPSFWRIGTHLHTLPPPSLSLVTLLDKTHILSIFLVYFLHLLAHENFMPIVDERMRASLWGVSSSYHCSEEDRRTCCCPGCLTAACWGTVLATCPKLWNPSAVAVEPRKEPRRAMRSLSDRQNIHTFGILKILLGSSVTMLKAQVATDLPPCEWSLLQSEHLITERAQRRSFDSVNCIQPTVLVPSGNF